MEKLTHKHISTVRKKIKIIASNWNLFLISNTHMLSYNIL